MILRNQHLKCFTSPKFCRNELQMDKFKRFKLSFKITNLQNNKSNLTF